MYVQFLLYEVLFHRNKFLKRADAICNCTQIKVQWHEFLLTLIHCIYHVYAIYDFSLESEDQV